MWSDRPDDELPARLRTADDLHRQAYEEIRTVLSSPVAWRPVERLARVQAVVDAVKEIATERA